MTRVVRYAVASVSGDHAASIINDAGGTSFLLKGLGPPTMQHCHHPEGHSIYKLRINYTLQKLITHVELQT
jgi:hypothetical protein